jgi:hypothetical protein
MLAPAAMSSDYALILRACPESHRESAAAFIGRMFSLKEHTCQQIVQSCPIALLAGLGREEAAAVHLLVHALAVTGATVEVSAAPVGELPKIDWPRRPQLFKRELGEWITDLQVPVPLPGGAKSRVIDLLLAAIDPKPAGTPYTGSALPEVTPFSTPALPRGETPRPLTTRTPLPAPPQPAESRPPTTRTPLPAPPQPQAGTGGSDDPMSRLNELFPEEEGGFMPGKEDITNILNRILPDEEAGGQPGTGGSGRKAAVSGGFSVFLAKIADEDKRKKAAQLIVDIAKLPADEAEALSKKMIIPVLKGVSKEEAEAAKAQFGKIGILARIKEG